MIEPMLEDRKVEVIDACVPIAAELVHGVRELGTDRLNELLARIPEDGRGVMYLLLAAMVNPDQHLGAALAWTDTLPVYQRRGRRPVSPAEQERQRLVAEGVPEDMAILRAAQLVAARQETTRDRMLRVTRATARRAA